MKERGTMWTCEYCRKETFVPDDTEGPDGWGTVAVTIETERFLQMPTEHIHRDHWAYYHFCSEKEALEWKRDRLRDAHHGTSKALYAPKGETT